VKEIRERFFLKKKMKQKIIKTLKEKTKKSKN